MSEQGPKVAVQVRLQFGKYVNPSQGVDDDVVLLTFDTETEPKVTYALSREQAAQLAAGITKGG